MSVRIGIGYDVHRLTEGRRFVLGGVEVPWKKGLEGHSDADVLVHAVCDALLGAVGAGDIGRHFPDNDPSYAGISSLVLLKEVSGIVASLGFTPQNVDVTVVLEEPRIQGYIPDMVANVAEALGVSPEMVNIKATTSEGLGFVGKGKGVVAYAAASVLGFSKPDRPA